MAYRFDVQIPYFTGLARDVVTNTFHLDHPLTVPGPAELAAAADELVTFYESTFAGVPGGLEMAPWMRPADTRITAYDLDTTPPRVPVYDEVRALDVEQSSSTALPLEAAMVVSYRADYVGGIPRARQRGRIYLGGLSGSSIESGLTSSFPQFSPASRLAASSSAAALVGNMELAGWVWVVYSRAGDREAPIVAGWVDAEIDTQRRRGNVMHGTRTPWATP